jgi:pimeloyl-ACP methyl ester carboxylesterase
LESIWRTGLITVGRCQLEYKYQDHPDKTWVVFLHGFGQNYRAFEPVYEIWQGRYSFLALHIFFHGESHLDNHRPLQTGEWAELMKALFAKLGIKKAHWIGYSLGAKFTMAAFQQFPEGFERITLFAPDGLVMNPWYRFATQNAAGRIFIYVILRYLPFLRYLIWLAGKAGIIPGSLSRFVESQLSSAPKRKQVLATWMVFRKIWPDTDIWHSLFQQHKLTLTIVLGSRDSIIPVEKFRDFRLKYTGMEWQEIKAGHANILERWAETRSGDASQASPC